MGTPRKHAARALVVALVLGGGVVGGVVAGVGTGVANETGIVVGSVWFDRDGDGSRNGSDAPRAGVPVDVRQVASGVHHAAVTDDQGQFRVEGLPLGTYEVTAAHAGHRSVLPPTMEVTLTDWRPRSTYFPQIGSRVLGRAWDDTSRRAPTRCAR